MTTNFKTPEREPLGQNVIAERLRVHDHIQEALVETVQPEHVRQRALRLLAVNESLSPQQIVEKGREVWRTFPTLTEATRSWVEHDPDKIPLYTAAFYDVKRLA